MNVLVAHDYCTQRGGAERVALILLEAFRDSGLATSLYDAPSTFDEFGEHPIRTSLLQPVAAFRRDPRLAFLLLANAWSRMRAEDSDVVVCSSSGWAHGIHAPAGVRKIVYCHNPARWLYQADDYLDGSPRAVAAVARAAGSTLRRWDDKAAQTADLYVANSSVVARRIKAAYGIDAVVVNPPSALEASMPREPVPGIEPGYWLTVGRGRGYKHTHVVAAAIARGGHGKLVVVGGYDGVEEYPNVIRLQDVSDAQLCWLYANARAVVSLSFEDFGLTPVEGFQFGTPAVLLRKGGFLDSMVEGVTGTFAEAPTPDALLEALDRLPGSYDVAAIRRHAQRFSVGNFQRTMRRLALGAPKPADVVVPPQRSVTVEPRHRATPNRLPVAS